MDETPAWEKALRYAYEDGAGIKRLIEAVRRALAEEPDGPIPGS